MADYTAQEWVDGAVGNTPLSSARLNNMEAGIAGSLQKSGGLMTGALRGNGSDTLQTGAAIGVRKSGNDFEFGHGNQAGYGSTLGAEAGTGQPFVAFFAEHGGASNTYTTRGFKPMILRGGTSGQLDFLTTPNANAVDQSPTLVASLTNDGRIASKAHSALNPKSASDDTTGLVNGNAHNALVMTQYTQASGHGVGVVSIGHSGSGRRLVFGRQSGADYSVSTFVPTLTLFDSGVVQAAGGIIMPSNITGAATLASSYPQGITNQYVVTGDGWPARGIARTTRWENAVCVQEVIADDRTTIHTRYAPPGNLSGAWSAWRAI